MDKSERKPRMRGGDPTSRIHANKMESKPRMRGGDPVARQTVLDERK